MALAVGRPARISGRAPAPGQGLPRRPAHGRYRTGRWRARSATARWTAPASVRRPAAPRPRCRRSACKGRRRDPPAPPRQPAHAAKARIRDPCAEREFVLLWAVRAPQRSAGRTQRRCHPHPLARAGAEPADGRTRPPPARAAAPPPLRTRPPRSRQPRPRAPHANQRQCPTRARLLRSEPPRRSCHGCRRLRNGQDTHSVAAQTGGTAGLGSEPNSKVTVAPLPAAIALSSSGPGGSAAFGLSSHRPNDSK